MYFVAPCSWSHSKPTPCTVQGSPAREHPGDKAQLSLLQLSGKPGCENRAGTSGKTAKCQGNSSCHLALSIRDPQGCSSSRSPAAATDEALTTPSTTRFWGISPNWDRNFSPNLLSQNLRISGGGKELQVGAGFLPCSCSLCSGMVWIWKLLVHLMCLNIGNSNPLLSPTWSQCEQMNVVNT